MAFDFERYLQVCELDNSEFYTNLPATIATIRKNSDEAPEMAKTLVNLEQAVTSPRRLSAADDERHPPLSSLLDEWRETPATNNSGGLEKRTYRCRPELDYDPKRSGRGRVALHKQTSLPASFWSYSGSKTEGRRRRRSSVKFADEVGENLTTFMMIPSRFEDAEHEDNVFGSASRMIVLENRSTLPTETLDPDEVDLPVKSSHETRIFQPLFDQPAADFEQFRERLTRQFVCLENVKVDVKSQTDGTSNGFVNHGTVLCTIKVRNLHPTKRVFARCTDNRWRTHADITAVYVGDGTSDYNENDTFTFALRNPFGYRTPSESCHPEVDDDSYCRRNTAAVEFALCYEVQGSTYWDNNDGQNYKIVWI